MFSQIIVIGNVGRNPEIKHMGDGSLVANFSIAVNDRFTTKAGEKRETTTWFQVDAWQQGDHGLVDIISKYVVVGTQLMVQGRPVMDQWTDKATGQPRQAFRIRLSGPSAQLRLLGGKRPGDAPAEGVEMPMEEPAHGDLPASDALPASEVSAPATTRRRRNGGSTPSPDADVPF